MKVNEITYKPNLKLRIFATLIDYGIYFLILYLAIDVFGKQTDPNTKELNGFPGFMLFLYWFVYFPGLEAIIGATPGHDIFKLKVLRTDGEKLGFFTALKRRICDPIDILFYGIPAMICISKTEKYQRIGDLLAGTVVVKKSDIIEKELNFR